MQRVTPLGILSLVLNIMCGALNVIRGVHLAEYSFQVTLIELKPVNESKGWSYLGNQIKGGCSASQQSIHLSTRSVLFVQGMCSNCSPAGPHVFCCRSQYITFCSFLGRLKFGEIFQSCQAGWIPPPPPTPPPLLVFCSRYFCVNFFKQVWNCKQLFKKEKKKKCPDCTVAQFYLTGISRHKPHFLVSCSMILISLFNTITVNQHKLGSEVLDEI